MHQRKVGILPTLNANASLRIWVGYSPGAGSYYVAVETVGPDKIPLRPSDPFGTAATRAFWKTGRTHFPEKHLHSVAAVAAHEINEQCGQTWSTVRQVLRYTGLMLPSPKRPLVIDTINEATEETE